MIGDFEFLYNTFYSSLEDNLYFLLIPYFLNLILYTSPIWSVFIVPILTFLFMGPWTLLSGAIIGITAAIESETMFEAYEAFKEPKGKNSLNIASYTKDMETFLGN